MNCRKETGPVVCRQGGDARLLVGSMDGTVSLLDANTGELLGSGKPHRKYVVRVRWGGDGETFVSASWDHSFAVHRCSTPGEAEGPFETLKVGQGVGFGT